MSFRPKQGTTKLPPQMTHPKSGLSKQQSPIKVYPTLWVQRPHKKSLRVSPCLWCSSSCASVLERRVAGPSAGESAGALEEEGPSVSLSPPLPFPLTGTLGWERGVGLRLSLLLGNLHPRDRPAHCFILFYFHYFWCCWHCYRCPPFCLPLPPGFRHGVVCAHGPCMYVLC